MWAAHLWACHSIYPVLLTYKFCCPFSALGVQAWPFAPVVAVMHCPLNWREAGDVLPLRSVCLLGPWAHILPRLMVAALHWSLLPCGMVHLALLVNCAGEEALEEARRSACTTVPILCALDCCSYKSACVSGLRFSALLHTHRLCQSPTCRCKTEHSYLLFAHGLLVDVKEIFMVLRCLWRSCQPNQSECVSDVCFLENRQLSLNINLRNKEQVFSPWLLKRPQCSSGWLPNILFGKGEMLCYFEIIQYTFLNTEITCIY